MKMYPYNKILFKKTRTISVDSQVIGFGECDPSLFSTILFVGLWGIHNRGEVSDKQHGDIDVVCLRRIQQYCHPY